MGHWLVATKGVGGVLVYFLPGKKAGAHPKHNADPQQVRS